jgi:hypothetical protein
VGARSHHGRRDHEQVCRTGAATHEGKTKVLKGRMRGHLHDLGVEKGKALIKTQITMPNGESVMAASSKCKTSNSKSQIGTVKLKIFDRVEDMCNTFVSPCVGIWIHNMYGCIKYTHVCVCIYIYIYIYITSYWGAALGRLGQEEP